MAFGGRRSTHRRFKPYNPETGEACRNVYPVSVWEDCEEAIAAATVRPRACCQMPGSQLADFLHCYADRIEHRKSELVELAHLETGLPAAPRLSDVELPRTAGQLRQAAAAAATGSWVLATIDTAANIRSIWLPSARSSCLGRTIFPLRSAALRAAISRPRLRPGIR